LVGEAAYIPPLQRRVFWPCSHSKLIKMLILYSITHRSQG
jgi:hypothetical protein